MNINRILFLVFQIIGSLGLLLYGMKLLSDGVQKSAGASLHKILGLMTGNRFSAVFTGIFVTMIIQSSSATTVMVVSFVNAGLMTLTQSIGVIFGANIGTTITAWIVALFGFKFKIALFAVPVFGIGYALTFIKKFKQHDFGEALMGFGLLFLGLDLLSSAIPSPSAADVEFLQFFADKGFLGTLAGIAAGMVLTILLHSSSAATAIIITLAHNGILSWELSAAIVLGSNIGTTIDAVLASIGTRVNARRAALVHVLFNVSGTILAIFFIQPLLTFVEFLVPGGNSLDIITTQLAVLHTVFNVFCTILFLPFVTQLARLTEKLIQPGLQDETPETYRLEFIPPGVKDNPEAYIIRAEKELTDMATMASTMFDCIKEGVLTRDGKFIALHFEPVCKQEEYANQMHEQLTKYLSACAELALSSRMRQNVSLMAHIVDELEDITDNCKKAAVLLKRSVDKQMVFSREDSDRLQPYADLVRQFLHFITENINKHLNQEKLNEAQTYEGQIDTFRTNLKKIAKKRLQEGANVRAELLYIDLIRELEKIGDHAFSISEFLAQTK